MQIVTLRNAKSNTHFQQIPLRYVGKPGPNEDLLFWPELFEEIENLANLVKGGQENLSEDIENVISKNVSLNNFISKGGAA